MWDAGGVISRRELLIGGAALAACRRGPAIRTRGPDVTHGVAVGDVSTGRALVWARSDSPARMIVEWDTTDRFANPRRVAGPVVTQETGLAATMSIDGLPDAQTVFVRARFEREAERGAGAWQVARFNTPNPTKFRVAWTGDTCGQGYGRNPEWGGLRGYAALRAAKPDVFVNSGDLIYGDNPILPEQTLVDGRIWRNITNERVARPAQTLDDFRARFAYNLEDEHLRAFAAEVPVVAQWDDHETHNNWCPGQQLDDARYTERDASKLAAFAQRAMREWVPLPAGPIHRVVSYGPLLDIFVLDCRTWRTPNDTGIGTAMLGAAQAKWFVDALARSRARWKLVACDQPLSLVIGDGPNDERFEGFGNTPGAPRGREVELAAVLSAIQRVTGVLWITADVHYAAAHHYDPARGTGGTFAPFWEFVAGPIHAGTFGPNPLDPTFGPEVKFQWAPPPGQGNLAPWDGLQSFGTIDVTREALSVGLWGIDGQRRFSVELT
ncbi:MAG: alkaline phosphatase [Kofleriaceae bacterium]|nr:alkaline phosphatase [Kofleriaceae bacterium]